MESSFQSQDSFGEKISREFELVSAAGQGVVNAAAAAWENKGDSAAKLVGSFAGGAALSFLSSHHLAGKVVLGAAAVSFGLEVLDKGKEVAGAAIDTWQSADRLEQNKALVGNSIGNFVVDTTLMSAGGILGTKFAGNQTVNSLVKRAAGEVQARLPSTVFWKEERLLNELAAYHPGTAQHSRRVGSLSEEISKELGFTTQQQVVTSHAAKMHDIGKLETPKEILAKKGPLTAQEREIMQRHPAATKAKLDELHYPQRFGETPSIAAAHHENLDGSGYHLGLKANEIAPEMRVLKVADEWDALTQTRDYKPRWPMPKVEETLKAEVAAGHVDGSVLKALYQVPAARILQIMSDGVRVPYRQWLEGVSLRRFLDVAVYGAKQRAGEPSFRSIFNLVYNH